MTTVRSAEPNVTPMIDVLLVLLIIFMVTSIRVQGRRSHRRRARRQEHFVATATE